MHFDRFLPKYPQLSHFEQGQSAADRGQGLQGDLPGLVVIHAGRVVQSNEDLEAEKIY